MKGAIVLAAAIVAVALGACRREEAAPLKLGADVPAVADVRSANSKSGLDQIWSDLED